MKRLACLLSLGLALAAPPVLGAVKGVPQTVATVSPSLSTADASRSGCTPINPCAVAAPALGNATLPAPEMPPQPALSAATDTMPDPASAAPPQRTANADCPPARGRGAFAGRAGNGARGRVSGRGQGGIARDADGCPRPVRTGGAAAVNHP